MAQSLAKLTVQLEAQTAKYQRELEKANRKLDRFSRRQKKQTQAISNAFKTIGTAIAAAFSLRALNSIRRFTSEAAASADALAKQADILGFTTEKLAAYQLAARLSGSSNEGLEKGIKKLQKSIVDATNGLTTYTRAFDALKLSPAELKRLAPDQQFERIAKAFANLETQTDKVAVAYDLFGGRNTQLIKLMEQVGSQMTELEEQTERWGLAISRVDAAKIEEARDSIEKSKTAVQGLATQLALKLAPVVTDIANRFSNAIDKSDGFFATIGAFIAQGTGDLKKRAEQLENEIAVLTSSSQFKFAAEGSQARKDLDYRLAVLAGELTFTKEIIEQNKRRERQLALQAQLIDEIQIPDPKERSEELQKAFDTAEAKMQRLADSFVSEFATAEEELRAKFENFKLIETMLPPDLAARARKELEEQLANLTVPVELIPELKIPTGDDLILRPDEDYDTKPLERSIDLVKDKTEELDNAWADLGLQFASAFEDAIVEGKKLSDVLKGLLQDIIRIAVRKSITEPLGNLFSGIFGGGKAAGGPVMAGTTYLVGEEGPEFFTPTRSGHIIPNAGGAIAISNVINIDSRADRAQIIAEIGPIMERTKEQTKAEIMQARIEGRS